MAVGGNLNTMALADILQWLAQGRYTGTLVIGNGRVEKSIFLREGTIISSGSTDPKEQLGHFLVSHGFISEDDLTTAIKMQGVKKVLLGKILLQQGAISEEELNRMLVLKAEETIFELFGWTDGSFRFLDGELPAYEMVPISLDVDALLLEGMQRSDEWSQIREAIPSAQCVPVAVADLVDPGGSGDGERVVLSLVDDDRSIEEICLQSHSSEYYVSRTLYRTLQSGKLKVVRPRVVAGVEPPGAASAQSLVAEAGSHIDDGRLELGLRRLRAAGQLEPGNIEAKQAIGEGEARIRDRLEEAGVHGGVVPSLEIPIAELTSAKIMPEEGFLLSRITGTTDLASIVAISPLPELDVLVTVWKLCREGYIGLG